MNDEKERGLVAGTRETPKGESSKLIVASEVPGVNKVPAWLPKVKLPRNDQECRERVQNAQHQMGRKIDAYCDARELFAFRGELIPALEKYLSELIEDAEVKS